MLVRTLALTLLASVAVAAPASAAPQAVAYFRPHPKDAAATTVVFRTADALPGRVSAWMDGRGADLQVVSPNLHCYLAQVPGRLGGRVKVRIGRRGRFLDATLPVRAMSAANARGAALGCDADPASKAVVFGLYPTPQVEPDRWFFSADAGPYLRDLTWTDWGSATATATGTYISDCASCGPAQEYPVTVRLDGLVACPGWGAQAYEHLFFERAGGRLPSDPPAERRTLALPTGVYC